LTQHTRLFSCQRAFHLLIGAGAFQTRRRDASRRRD
jgi:hypothetical protein